MLQLGRPSIVRVARPLIGVRNPLPGPPIPDLLLDFETGAGIPLSAGGAGGLGSDLVQVLTPQDSGGNTRLVRALRYWDPAAPWTQGEPIFVPKQVGRLVGWPGPREGGYWTGPMPSLASTSETVAVYSPHTGVTVTPVAGGVVGPDAIRCDVVAGETGDGSIAWPAAAMTSGWTVDASGNGTVCYLHAVVELIGDISDYLFKFGLYDNGSFVFAEQLFQRYDTADTQRSGKVYRGIGPHGGHLYEIWALARLISPPVGPLSAFAYLLSSGRNPPPARTVIIHGVQTYFLPSFMNSALARLPPFFSYARGAAVVWSREEVRVNFTEVANSVALKYRAAQFDVGGTVSYSEAVSRNNYWGEALYQHQPAVLRIDHPTTFISGFNSRAVVRTNATYARAATVDGQTIVSAAAPNAPPTPQFLGIGQGSNVSYGRYARVLIWRRALTDAELLAAFKLLGEPSL